MSPLMSPPKRRRSGRQVIEDDDDDAVVSSKAQTALDKLKESIRQRTHAHQKHANKFAKWQRQVDKARTEVLENNKSTRRDEYVP